MHGGAFENPEVNHTAAGARVVVSSRAPDDLAGTLDEIAATGSSGISALAGGTTRDGATAPVRAAIESYGRTEILINNVGGQIHSADDAFTGDVDIGEKVLALKLLTT